MSKALDAELATTIALSRAAKSCGVRIGDVAAGDRRLTINLELISRKAGPLTIRQLARTLHRLSNELEAGQ